MSERPARLTIGLPVYNGESVLAQSIEALLSQTFEDFELVISDNASTDGTEAICRDFAARDRRIRYLRRPTNIGASPNFNGVFHEGTSPYFKWAAADDLHHPTYLEKAVAILDERPEVLWVHSRSSHIDETGQLLDEPEALDVSYAERGADSAHERFAAVLLSSAGCLDAYGVMRREAVAKTPLYLSHYGSEKIFMAELALLGRYAEIPETLFFARVFDKGSGNLGTAEEQQAFIDPSKKSRPSLARFHYLAGYLSAIARSAPDAREAALCRLAVLRWLMQISKWKSVAMRAITGRGLGGANVERVKRINQQSGGAEGDRLPSAAVSATPDKETARHSKA